MRDEELNCVRYQNITFVEKSQDTPSRLMLIKVSSIEIGKCVIGKISGYIDDSL